MAKQKDNNEGAKRKRANEILSRASAMQKVKDVYSRKWAEYEKIWKRTDIWDGG